MLREFFASGPAYRLLFAWMGLFVFVGHGLFKAYIKWALNRWYAEFYDALQDLGWYDPVAELPSGDPETLVAQYDNMDAYETQSEHLLVKRQEVSWLLVRFALLVAPAIVVHPIAKWISSNWRFSWRMALMTAYLAHYDVGQRPIEGSAQRIHEDTQRFEEGIYACLATILDSLLTLIIFIPVLLEVGMRAQPKGVLKFDGWLVCIAVFAAVGGLWVSMCVGRRLVLLEVQNQKVEALLRTKLVVLEEQPASVVGVERPDEEETEAVDPDEFTNVSRGARRPRLISPAPFFRKNKADLWRNYHRLFADFAVFNTWISAYDQVMTIVPYALAAPLMFSWEPSNRITLGTLMQVSNAFDKVFGAMAVVSENWAAVNDFRSTIYRLREFERHTYARKRYDHTLLRDTDVHEVTVVAPLADSVLGVELSEPKPGEARRTNGMCTRVETGHADE